MHYFTEDWADIGKYSGTGWANTEVRSFTFSDQDVAKAHLIETPASRSRREEKPLDKEERTNLTRTATKTNDKDNGNSGYSQASQIQAKV